MPVPIATEGYLFSGTCSSHDSPRSVSGVIIAGTGNPTTLVNGVPAALIGSQVLADCGHTGIITTGSTQCAAGGIGLALVGSIVGAGSGNVTGTITGPPPGVTPNSFTEF